MIFYFIQLSSIWTILLIAFYLFYRNQSYHQLNRIYILLAILAGIIIPLLPSTFGNHPNSIFQTGLQSIYTLDEVIVSVPLHAGKNNYDYLFIIGLISYACLVLMKLYQTIREFSLYNKLTRLSNPFKQNAFIQFSDACQQPFSFFNTMVLPKYLEHDSKTKEIIIAHELTHIKYRHYYDLLILKILDILLPYHPCLYFFKRELVLIHEYQADQAAVLHANEEEYSNVLIQFAQKTHLHSSIIHTFYYSPVKSRIMMLFKKSTNLQYVNLVLVPFLFLACTYVNQDAEKLKTEEAVNKERNENEGRISLPPIYKGDTTITHSNIASGESLFQANFPGGQKELMEFLGKNIKYPDSGKKNKIQGTTYVRFEIYEDGSIHDKVILRSLGDEFDKEVLRVLNLMPNWIPGEKNHSKRKETYTLPIKFKLSD